MLCATPPIFCTSWGPAVAAFIGSISLMVFGALHPPHAQRCVRSRGLPLFLPQTATLRHPLSPLVLRLVRRHSRGRSAYALSAPVRLEAAFPAATAHGPLCGPLRGSTTGSGPTEGAEQSSTALLPKGLSTPPPAAPPPPRLHWLLPQPRDYCAPRDLLSLALDDAAMQVLTHPLSWGAESREASGGSDGREGGAGAHCAPAAEAGMDEDSVLSQVRERAGCLLRSGDESGALLPHRACSLGGQSPHTLWLGANTAPRSTGGAASGAFAEPACRCGGGQNIPGVGLTIYICTSRESPTPPAHTLQYASPSLAMAFGIDPADIIGKTVLSMARWSRVPHPKRIPAK